MDKAPASDTSLSGSAAVPDPSTDLDLTGVTLGDFKIRRRLGQGGMGQVYLAEQITLKREVALKTLRGDLAANRQSLERFDAEAKAVAKATHANIVQIYVIDKAQVQNQTIHYLALEYVDGRNLRELLEKKGTPDLHMGLSIMHQVASALQRASELGIIHRDIKPENILISRQGEVKVADFGLSRCFTDEAQAHNLTQTGVSMGTPLYMAPEQVELRPVDPRTDIYSFGVTCYHMWVGQPPFRGSSPFEIAAQHVMTEPAPLQDIRPDLPSELCALIHRMMAKKPEDRPQTSREIMREVGRLRDMTARDSSDSHFAAPEDGDLGEPVPSLPKPVAPVAGPSRPHRLLFAGLMALLAFAAGLGATYLYKHYPTENPSPISEQPAVVNKNMLGDEKENELISMKDKHTPPKEPADVKYTLDLGIFYLENRWLDKAEALFQDLIGAKEFGDVGKLGLAMVLAFRAETNLSNQKFRELLPREKKEVKPREDMANFWRNYPPWRKMMATALYHDKANSPTIVGPFWARTRGFPPQLETWLRAPGLRE